MRKVLLFLVLMSTLGLLMAPYSSASSINSSNTVVVLPTMKVVNGIPLHIGEDAISGSRLGAFLVLQGITTGEYSTTVRVPVEYHSAIIPDENQLYRLNRRDMPDVGVNVSNEPVGNAVVVAVNFSRVEFNSTAGAVSFGDRSVEIVFNENTTPLDVRGNYRMVYATVDGKDTLYLYTTNESLSESKSLGEEITVGKWRIEFLDINLDVSQMLVMITYPNGESKQKPMDEGKYYLMYQDAHGNVDFEEYDSYPAERVDELLKGGALSVFIFVPTDLFVGINNAQMVTFDYWYYQKAREYQDGEIYRGQWVWDIDPSKNLYTLYLHVTGSAEFPRVLIKPGEALSLPTNWNLSIEPLFKWQKDKLEGVEGYRFVRRVVIAERVTITAPEVQVTDDVNSLIINDTALTEIPRDRNVIIVGGWVSNRAWNLLEKVYGNSTIDAIKDEVMEKGYVIKVLPNPYNPKYKVIILAGKTYKQTREAVDRFMEEL